MLKDNPTKVEIGGTLVNVILKLNMPRPFASRDPEAEFKMVYAHEWAIVGDAFDNPDGGSFSTQTGTVYQALDAKFGWLEFVKASDVVGMTALPEPLQSGDGPHMVNLSYVEAPPEE